MQERKMIQRRSQLKKNPGMETETIKMEAVELLKNFQQIKSIKINTHLNKTTKL